MWIGATQGSAKACDGVDALQRRSVDSVTASSSDERVDKATRLAGYELASIHPVRRCDVQRPAMHPRGHMGVINHPRR